MKRKFTFLIAAMALIFAMMTPREAWGQNQSVTMAYSGSATTNMTSGNNAASVGLDASHWNVAADKGGNNNFPGLNKAGQIRLYGSSSNHNVITVTNSDNATITSITVTYGSSNYNAKVTVGGVVVTGTGPNTEKTYSINNSSFSIAHNYSSTTQVYIVSIVINYSSQTLTSIAVQTPPTKTTYNVDETFDPTGLVIKATYDTGDPEDITYAGNENKFTFNPGLTTALTKVNNKVTITYGEKSVDQEITVNLNKLATPTHLNATPASTSATLTWDAVANASSYDVKLNGETKTTETNSLLVENLTASTTYTWTVKAIGDGTTYDNSDESEPSEFTTSAPPTVAYTVTFNGNEHGTPASGFLTENPAGSGVTLPDCTPSEGYQFVGWATTNSATEANAGEAGATYYPSANTTLYAVYNKVFTITWSVNGTPTIEGNPTTSVVESEGITIMPTTPASISGMAFQGWTATQIATSSATAPTDLFTDAEHAPAITANTTFYAVFAEESEGDVTWNKVSAVANVEVGEYVIINNSFYLPNTTTSSAPSQVAAPTITDNKIANTDVTAVMQWSLSDAGEGKFYVKNSGGDYLYATSDNNGIRVGKTSDKWTFEANNGALAMKESSNSRYCATYKSGSDWRSYTSANHSNYGDGGKLYLYKKTAGAPTYSNYCTTVVTKVLESIELSGDYPTEFWKGETFNHDGITVTAHYENADDENVTDKATFTGYDMATAGEQTVTVSYGDKTATYDITVKTIANTQETAYTVAEAKAIIDAGKDLGTEVYVKGTVSKVDGINDGAITYWLDNNTFEVYKGKNVGNEAFTNVNQISVNDDVIIYGKIKKYNNSTYEFDSGNYLVSHVKAATLSINDITVSLGEEISPKIITNVTGEYTITYFVPSEGEGVVKVDEDGNLVIVAVGGPVTVTAKLTAAGYKDAETTFTVEVIKALTSIKIATPPTTTSYKVGDKFDPTGLVITANYNNGSTEDVAYAGNEDKFTFEPSLETPLSEGNTSVTITYAGKTTTQTITVRELYTYDITWMANGEEHTTTQVTEGDAVVLPENPSAVGDMAFQGWINTESYYNAETAPEYIVPSGIIPTGAMTFYAVYAKHTSEFQEKDVTYTFTSKSWADATSSWTSGKDGSQYTTNQGVQVTTGVTGANATSKSAFTEVTKVVVNYCTNTSKGKGTIQVKVGDGTAQSYSVSAPSSGGTTLRNTDDMIFGNETGKVNITVECGTNSIYINSITITSKVGEETISNFCTTVAPIVISENTVWDGNVTINGNTTVTIENDAVLTVNGALTNLNAANLVIKDGGQLVFNNSGVKATVEKNIIPYSSNKDGEVKGWHFLAAPMEDFKVESFINQANGKYDLYKWYIKEDGTPIWYNYKAHTDEFEPKFVSGRGYLAAYEKKDLIEMQGTLNAGTTFSFTEELNGKGNFTLLGNPFTYELKWSDFTMENVYDKGFAVVDSEDGIIEYVAGDDVNTIKVGTGFMVYTNGDNAKLSFTKGSRSGKSNDILALNLLASNENGEDNTIIVIDDENGGFAKADNFNTNVPQIYTERLQTKYGIRNFSTNTKEFFVSFKAVGEGSNTIRLETIGEFDYVHLYDKLTDVDVDMLLEGSYTFEASEDDDTHRFIVRIDKGNTGIDENETENFVNVYNGEIHVSGSGEVQIFDIMGRIVHSEVISGDATISTGGFKGGVYVVRLIGNGWTKAEKIVVRR